MAEAFANIGGSIAVISDFKNDCCYIYSGAFGKALNIPAYARIDSAFEDCIFSAIDPSDLIDRHILELRFFEFVKTLPVEVRTEYLHSCILNVTTGGREMSILHHTRYLDFTQDGCVTLGICTYNPVGDKRTGEFEGYMFNLNTGESIDVRQIEGIDETILSRREREVLGLLSEGFASKQIADKLHISLNTVYRHRQNILHHLNVINTAEAVKIGLRMQLI
ncbi:helix-turn-helix transcriptional regulator [uncultured Muribaculum sp.]|nr:helix-turn-helix transcriptional regulator [uncultured Muribaculum sp.]